MRDIVYRGHRDHQRGRVLRRFALLPTGEYVESRGVVATAIALSALAAAATAGGAVASGAIGAHAAGEAADKQVGAANHAADIQDQAAQRAEAFQRQQAENEWLNSQNTQHANYDQSKARYGSIAGVASQYGLNLPELPAFAAGIDPHYTGGGAPAGSVAGAAGSSSGVPSVDPSKGDLAGQISAYFKSRGVSDAETPYWVSKWSEFGAKDPAYFNQRLSQADIFGKGAAPAGSIAGAAKPSNPALVAPIYSTPQVSTPIPSPYQPGTIAGARRY